MIKTLGMLYVPDYITNAGGVIAVDGHLGHDISNDAIAERIRGRVLEIILEAQTENKTPQEVADAQSQHFVDHELTIAPLPLAAAERLLYGARLAGEGVHDQAGGRWGRYR